jgi:hypothetical protein
MIRSQPDLIVARISAMIPLPVELEETRPTADNKAIQNLPLNPDDVVQQQYNCWMRSPTWLRYLFGQLVGQRQRHQRKKVDVLEARYQLPYWLSEKVWEVQRHSTPLDWGLKVKTYRILPSDAPIFKSVRSGDVDGVRRLLLSGEALISDRNVSGESLLHASIFIPIVVTKCPNDCLLI